MKNEDETGIRFFQGCTVALSIGVCIWIAIGALVWSWIY